MSEKSFFRSPVGFLRICSTGQGTWVCSLPLSLLPLPTLSNEWASLRGFSNTVRNGEISCTILFLESKDEWFWRWRSLKLGRETSRLKGPEDQSHHRKLPILLYPLPLFLWLSQTTWRISEEKILTSWLAITVSVSGAPIYPPLSPPFPLWTQWSFLPDLRSLQRPVALLPHPISQGSPTPLASCYFWLSFSLLLTYFTPHWL